MKLTMPLPPSIANQRLHWTAKHRAKKAYWKAVDARQNAGLIPSPPKAPFAKARISATLYVWSERDTDNAVASCKWSLEWLVTRGYIVDDRKKNIEWAGLPEQVIDRKDQRLEITLEAT